MAGEGRSGRGPERRGAAAQGGSRSGGGRGGSSRNGSDSSGRGRSSEGQSTQRGRSGQAPRAGKQGKAGEGPSGGKGGSPQRGGFSRPRRDGDDRAPRTAEQAQYDGPPIPEAVTGKELDRQVLDQLRGLPEKLAARVARHLAAAGLVIDEDPKTAYQHTLAARARAARVAVVREACGEAAYAAGEFAEALSELRAARRMNGVNDYLPMMADCERALNRPDKALALAKNPSVANLSPELQAEMSIVEAGARADLGELDGALRTLENAPLRSRSRADWVVRLRYAYADLLLKAGRRDDAVEWFHRTAGIDGNGVTDAADRILELEGTTVRDE